MSFFSLRERKQKKLVFLMHILSLLWEELETRKVLILQKNLLSNSKGKAVPHFLFSYLGRRNARFIKNEAGIVPLTGFLCVYPRSNNPEYIEKLWTILQDPNTISNLQLVGKSYGSGAIKVEPRSLERLPISSNLVHELGLKPAKSELSLFTYQST